MEPFAIPVANVTHLPGFPRRVELRARYEERTGAPVPDAPWYAALGGWKIAVIMEASYQRFRSGIADHPTFAALEEGVPHLARRALAFAERAGDLAVQCHRIRPGSPAGAASGRDRRRPARTSSDECPTGRAGTRGARR